MKNITNFVLIFLVSIYSISVRGHPIDAHSRQAREISTSTEDLLQHFTNGLITLKVSSKVKLMLCSTNPASVSTNSIACTHVCMTQLIFIWYPVYLQNVTQEDETGAVATMLQLFDFTCRTHASVMALKMRIQQHLFNTSTPQEDGFYKNAVTILSSLETAAATLQEIEVRKILHVSTSYILYKFL